MHTIRLRRPWSKTTYDTDGNIVSSQTKVDVPELPPSESDQQRDDKVRRVILCRAFNRPTGLAPDDQVWLRIDAVQATQWTVSINGMTLPLSVPHSGPTRIDLSQHLRPANRIEIELSSDQENVPAFLSGAVCLEIMDRDTAF